MSEIFYFQKVHSHLPTQSIKPVLSVQSKCWQHALYYYHN